MITINNTEVYGWQAAIRGMRNPLKSWANSDSTIGEDVNIGERDAELMRKLVAGGSEHRKFLRMIHVSADILAPEYWWKEYATYKVGTTENSTSTMHTIHKKEFTMSDFSTDQLTTVGKQNLEFIIDQLNAARHYYLATKDKSFWYDMVSLLPMTYNYLRTMDLNYEVLSTMYRQRKRHKLDEWRVFCAFVESLPYSWLITGGDAGA